ncbi:MAG: hypothetical protein ACPGUD_09800 [Parashewanella sp.]
MAVTADRVVLSPNYNKQGTQVKNLPKDQLGFLTLGEREAWIKCPDGNLRRFKVTVSTKSAKAKKVTCEFFTDDASGVNHTSILNSLNKRATSAINGDDKLRNSLLEQCCSSELDPKNVNELLQDLSTESSELAETAKLIPQPNKSAKLKKIAKVILCGCGIALAIAFFPLTLIGLLIYCAYVRGGK